LSSLLLLYRWQTTKRRRLRKARLLSYYKYQMDPSRLLFLCAAQHDKEIHREEAIDTAEEVHGCKHMIATILT